MSLLALGAPGCTEHAAYWTPEGHDATVAGSWTVRGAPADAATCAAAGLAEVALVFVHDTGIDAGTPDAGLPGIDFGTFTFPCAQARFDSRPTPALAAGTYVVRWRFVPSRDAGATGSETGPVTIVATPGGHVDVPPGDAI